MSNLTLDLCLRTISILTAFAVYLFSGIGLLAAEHSESARPNVVLIMADDLGFECIGANGGQSYATPVLDQLAADGLRFEHCYAQPICTPSRVKLMTGLANVRNYAVFGLLERSQTTFAHLFRDAGYATGIVGKWQLGKSAELPKHFGFDEHCLWQLLRRPSRFASPGLEVNGEQIDYPGRYGPDIVADFACDFIHRHKDEPFLLYYPMILTHCPFEPTPDSTDWDPTSRGSKTYKGDPKYFGDMVTYMDKIVGRLLAQLERSGVRKKTLVIFTADNGTDQPVVSIMNGVKVAGGKGKTTDAGTRVPLIAHWPGRTPVGGVCRDLVDLSDFLPTVCAAANIEVPVSIKVDGRSFLPQLRGERGQPREWLYIWYSRNGGPTGSEFARTQRFKLYRSGEFYDIQADVLEKRPLPVDALSTEQEPIYAKLRSALAQFADARPDEFAHWRENHQ